MSGRSTPVRSERESSKSKGTPVNQDKTETQKSKSTPSNMDKNDSQKKSKRGRPPHSKVNSSRDNSRAKSPRVSPARDRTEEDEPWTCMKCNVEFIDPADMLLECQRCKEHFCIGCLNKTEEEYKFLSDQPDLMWFCPPCRKKVEKNIVTDRKIEETCRDMMATFEERLKSMEDNIDTKCNEDKVREIVREEIGTTGTKQNTYDKEEVEKMVSEELSKKLEKVNQKDTASKTNHEIDRLVGPFERRTQRNRQEI